MPSDALDPPIRVLGRVWVPKCLGGAFLFDWRGIRLGGEVGKAAFPPNDPLLAGVTDGDRGRELALGVGESGTASTFGESEGEVGLLGLALGGLIALQDHDRAVPVGEFSGPGAEIGDIARGAAGLLGLGLGLGGMVNREKDNASLG